ncbi:unnamed protein product [Urochloa decumbens]|uniref:Uncharacterized protein n=1 Tax=Urochloa decumbens TaxID=240449 RepID=A0ABC8Y1L8_9POAL
MCESSSSGALIDMKAKKVDEFPMDGSDEVDDPKKRIEASKLFPGTYAMTGYAVNIMIKKGPEIKKETYNIMRNFQHNTVIRHLNFYPDSNAGRLVIPVVDKSFKSWISDNGSELIDRNGNMSELFKTMITDICDAYNTLCQKKILIKNFDYKNLYMARETTHRILVLVTEAEHMGTAIPKIALWKPIRDLIEWCYMECKVQPSFYTVRYTSFIGTKHFTVKSLRRYPQNWDNYTKGEYMLCLIAAHQEDIKSAMGPAGISWPKQDDKLLDLLQKIVEAHARNKFYYDPKIRFDYINLIRDTYKHFGKLPLHIRNMLGSKQGFIEVAEQWSPSIWQDLYDVIGWP